VLVQKVGGMAVPEAKRILDKIISEWQAAEGLEASIAYLEAQVVQQLHGNLTLCWKKSRLHLHFVTDAAEGISHKCACGCEHHGHRCN
jgi:hypothetical protein